MFMLWHFPCFFLTVNTNINIKVGGAKSPKYKGSDVPKPKPAGRTKTTIQSKLTITHKKKKHYQIKIWTSTDQQNFVSGRALQVRTNTNRTKSNETQQERV